MLGSSSSIEVWIQVQATRAYAAVKPVFPETEILDRNLAFQVTDPDMAFANQIAGAMKVESVLSMLTVSKSIDSSQQSSRTSG